MKLLASLTIVATLLLVPPAAKVSAQTAQMKPSSPAVVAPPTWSRAIKMPDGRTFVTDGGLMIDAAVARPATMPSVVLPVENGKLMAQRFDAPFDKEFGLAALRPGSAANSLETPTGITLNGNYVAFLGRVLPIGRTTLRTKGNMDPVIVVTDGKPVAIMMPLAKPK